VSETSKLMQAENTNYVAAKIFKKIVYAGIQSRCSVEVLPQQTFLQQTVVLL